MLIISKFAYRKNLEKYADNFSMAPGFKKNP